MTGSLKQLKSHGDHGSLRPSTASKPSGMRTDQADLDVDESGNIRRSHSMSNIRKNSSNIATAAQQKDHRFAPLKFHNTNNNQSDSYGQEFVQEVEAVTPTDEKITPKLPFDAKLTTSPGRPKSPLIPVTTMAPRQNTVVHSSLQKLNQESMRSQNPANNLSTLSFTLSSTSLNNQSHVSNPDVGKRIIVQNAASGSHDGDIVSVKETPNSRIHVIPGDTSKSNPTLNQFNVSLNLMRRSLENNNNSNNNSSSGSNSNSSNLMNRGGNQRRQYTNAPIGLCVHCKQTVLDNQTQHKFMDRVWHREHFYCVECKMNLVAFERSITVENNQLYCQFHRPASATKTMCAACNSPVLEGKVEALGKQWHQACFRCNSKFQHLLLSVSKFTDTNADGVECKSVLQSTYQPMNGAPYCRKCFLESNKFVCAECGLLIEKGKDHNSKVSDLKIDLLDLNNPLYARGLLDI